jgi:hypothetical protein
MLVELGIKYGYVVEGTDYKLKTSIQLAEDALGTYRQAIEEANK